MLRCDFADAARPTLGIENQNRAPPPRRLSTPTAPPWASTMDLTMDSPRPTPSLPLPAAGLVRSTLQGLDRRPTPEWRHHERRSTRQPECSRRQTYLRSGSD